MDIRERSQLFREDDRPMGRLHRGIVNEDHFEGQALKFAGYLQERSRFEWSRPGPLGLLVLAQNLSPRSYR